MSYLIYFILIVFIVLINIRPRHPGYHSVSSKPEFWLFVLAVLLINFAWEYFRGRALLNRWAEQNGYEILEAKRPFINSGPYTWHTYRGQIVYAVRVLDRQGNDRSGWVKLGGLWTGLLSNQVEEWWKDEPES